jgi:AraC-like DNA-binding protein
MAYDVTADGFTSHQRVACSHRPSGGGRGDAPGSLESGPVDQWLEVLISCGQSLADRVAEFQPHDLIHAIRALLAKIPCELPVSNRLVACSVFGHVMGRVAVVRHIDSKPEIERAFVAFAAARVTGECWQAELVHLYDCCIAALDETRLDSKQAPHQVTDARIARALSTIETRHRNPDLMLAEVARQANLSCWHLARILKRETGVGFVGHVRRARIKDAELLLSDSLLSVKEIAFLVGYRGPRQLDRDFKRVCGFTPVSFRRHVFRTRPTGTIDVRRS